MHHGQICFSTERVIVVESVAKQFIPALIKFAKDFAPGTGASKPVVEKAYANLIDAQQKGARFLLGGPKYIGPAELRPTIVTEVTNDMRIFDVESFGPSVSLYVVKNDEEAKAKANDSVYGLNAAIHTTDMNRALQVARRMVFCQIHVNNLTTYNEGEFYLRDHSPFLYILIRSN